MTNEACLVSLSPLKGFLLYSDIRTGGVYLTDSRLFRVGKFSQFSEKNAMFFTPFACACLPQKSPETARNGLLTRKFFFFIEGGRRIEEGRWLFSLTFISAIFLSPCLPYSYHASQFLWIYRCRAACPLIFFFLLSSHFLPWKSSSVCRLRYLPVTMLALFFTGSNVNFVDLPWRDFLDLSFY